MNGKCLTIFSRFSSPSGNLAECNEIKIYLDIIKETSFEERRGRLDVQGLKSQGHDLSIRHQDLPLTVQPRFVVSVSCSVYCAKTPGCTVQ